jgi:hypothetical protein
LTEKQSDVRYLGLVREFEKLIFPSSPASEGMAKLEAVKSAMKNIDELISEKKELTWARSWFSGIGHDETNPATLIMFVRLVGLNTRSLRELILEIVPPSEC